MEKALSPKEEQKLASAVEKAATLANANNKLDRNALLADCLNEAGVPSKLAKTASAAFNRRVTVLTFQKTADEHKIDSFPLTDSATVTELMGGKTLKKSASYTAPAKSNFYIGLSGNQPVMKKTASAKSVPAPKPLEERLNWGLFERHLESMLQKQAAEHTRLIGDLHKMRANIERRRIKIGEALTKSASFTQQTFYNLFGDAVTDYLGKDYKPSIRLWKTASFAVDPDTELSRQFKKLVADTDHCIALNDAIADYQQGLAEFSKTAADISSKLHKAFTMYKRATSLPVSAVGHLMAGGALQGINAVVAGGSQLGNVYIDALNQALADLPEESKSKSPSDVLTSKFLIKDRAQDRLMAWSDMAADPLLSKYPASQVFAATQKVMDMNPTLEGAGKREVLRAYVGQLLAQNGRASTADIASLSSTLKDIARNSSDTKAQLDAARALQDVQGKEGIKLKLNKQEPVAVHDYLSDHLKLYRDDVTKETKEEQDYNKALATLEQNANKLTQDERQQATKQYADALHALKIKTVNSFDPATNTVKIEYKDPSGRIALAQDTVDKIVESYLNQAKP